MANTLYDKARESFLKGEISWSSNTIKLALINTMLYTPTLATDQYLSTISGIAGAIVARSPAFTGKTTAAGVASSDPVVLTSVSGATAAALVIYQDLGGADTANRLIAWIDAARNEPFRPIVQSSQAPQLAPADSTTAIPARK